MTKGLGGKKSFFDHYCQIVMIKVEYLLNFVDGDRLHSHN